MDIKNKIEVENNLKATLELLRSSYDENEIISMFFNNLIKEHRTHQQLIIKKLYYILKEYAFHGTAYGTDLRNEVSTKWAQEATKKEVIFPFM